MLPDKLRKKLIERDVQNALRTLDATHHDRVDFSSNDYLGFSKSQTIYQGAAAVLKDFGLERNGATGSRLLSGNHALYEETEAAIARFHQVETALIFNSGYDANVGLISSIPQRGDVVLYDALCHASIRDGIKMSHAKAYKFLHNDCEDLRKILHSLREKFKNNDQEIYIVTESVFSMDGDSPDLVQMSKLAGEFNAFLIIDEAHAIGVLGSQGEGLVQQLGLEKDVFARVVTFGKALGCHGAAILGTNELKQYLINFARSFIYSTGLAPHSIATINVSYQHLKNSNNNILSLNSNITFFKSCIIKMGIDSHFIDSESAIQSCLVSGNDNVKELSAMLLKNKFDVRPILSPTVPKHQERLRICLHSYNTKIQIENMLSLITGYLS